MIKNTCFIPGAMFARGSKLGFLSVKLENDESSAWGRHFGILFRGTTNGGCKRYILILRNIALRMRLSYTNDINSYPEITAQQHSGAIITPEAMERV
ncbi:hypothetical protein C8U37_104115 [Trichococcus patagoniensis]|uniref:Uncharacterized protein n=1 Tax=Trichococcus patagoniensis TaxID=382641 RepID=A0A2T5INS6_9LACT|nr:hypothetical protein [Trichococcus patagoniensis]PTQ85478.1 hypothetical protein C8U37_104115 [Trichococcus patagoniensis]